MAIADEIERRRIRKRYYLETRADVLLRNREVFERWTRLGLRYMFLGIEAIDEEGLKHHRKRVHLGDNERALAVRAGRARPGRRDQHHRPTPDWDERRFAVVREWALEVPEIVNLTINTPYPGTETWLTESARRLTTEDYGLFDVQHAVLRTRLPLRRFYEEFVRTQDVLNRKHLGWQAVYDVFRDHGAAPRARADPISSACCGNSGASTTPSGCSPTTSARSCIRPAPPGVPVAGRPSPAELYVHHPTSGRGELIASSASRFEGSTRRDLRMLAPRNSAPRHEQKHRWRSQPARHSEHFCIMGASSSSG